MSSAMHSVSSVTPASLAGSALQHALIQPQPATQSSVALDAPNASHTSTNTTAATLQDTGISSNDIVSANSTTTLPNKPTAPALPLPNIHHYTPATQEIINRVSATANLSTNSPEWEAARQQVLKSMNLDGDQVSTGLSEAPSASVSGRGRGAGRGTNHGARTVATAIDVVAAPDAPVAQRKKGPGRPPGRSRAPGRSRSSRASGTRGTSTRGRARGSKRKRDDEDASDSGSDVSASYTPQATVTKSGRNITKPSTFNPVEVDSPNSGKPRRHYRRGPEFARCIKCQRGHSPASNLIVFCDGCNNAWHQWCHDPHISREVIEVAEMAWFCSACRRGREVEHLKMEDRVAGTALSDEEKRAYLSNLSSTTLVDLLLHSVSLHPTLPIFAPNTHDIVNAFPKPSPSPAASPATIAVAPSKHPHPPPPPPHPSHANDDGNGEDEEDQDPYPDYTNASNDPPATYPRPGHGPHKPRPTTDPEDLPWLLDDGFEVFEHLVSDGQGNLVPLPRWQDDVPSAGGGGGGGGGATAATPAQGGAGAADAMQGVVKSAEATARTNGTHEQPKPALHSSRPS